MNKEPQELIEARNLLKKFENSIENSEGMSYLMDAISLLDEVIHENFPPLYKERAMNIFKTYRFMVLKKVKQILGMTEPVEIGDIQHWLEIMKSFEDNNISEKNQDFNSQKVQLLKKYFLELFKSMSIQELEKLLAEGEEEEKQHQ